MTVGGMTGHVTLWCWLLGHAEAIWHVRSRGKGWECPTCLRFRASATFGSREVAR